MQTKKATFVALVVSILAVLAVATSVAASSTRNYSDWFDLDRINALNCSTNLTREASREEVAMLIANLADELGVLPSQRTLSFDDDDDFSSSTTYKTVCRLSSTGIVCGYPDGTFGPDYEITRAEALAMIIRSVDYFSLETNGSRRYSNGSYFSDMDGHWAQVYADRAYSEGLVAGRGNGRFYPDDDITREEIITILVNLMGESNNPLIAAIDQVYDLEFANSYGNDINTGYYARNSRNSSRYSSNSRYDDDDYYSRNNRYDDSTERPVVSTGSSSYSSSSYSSTSSSTVRPERPAVEVDTTTASTGDGSSRPSRPTVEVDTTSTSRSVSDASSVSAERPVVEVDTDTTVAAGSELGD